ncbi:hypothetical protein EST38_g10587 [Candolleomyces aberdarensis]|uniref:Uncharacterized protein n=1 Tax=Candolleomyces aberdarensis TaxID=2316362 RepID=A0A4Q2DAA7_9AGAR|nr:hypothetical protein EST38_g10587 [Candolleomyces aberdarensis]
MPPAELPSVHSVPVINNVTPVAHVHPAPTFVAECFVLPPDLELYRLAESRSFVSWVVLRRELFLRFLFESPLNLKFEKRYIDIFHKELDLTLIVHGVLAPYRESAPVWDCLDYFLAVILRKLPRHSASVGDLWLALQSGCFLDPSPLTYPEAMEKALSQWWQISDDGQVPNHSFADVRKCWRTWYDGTYILDPLRPVPEGDVRSAADLMSSVLSLLDEQTAFTSSHLDSLEQSLTRMIELQQRWDSVAYNGCAQPWKPIRLLDKASYIL